MRPRHCLCAAVGRSITRCCTYERLSPAHSQIATYLGTRNAGPRPARLLRRMCGSDNDSPTAGPLPISSPPMHTQRGTHRADGSSCPLSGSAARSGVRAITSDQFTIHEACGVVDPIAAYELPHSRGWHSCFQFRNVSRSVQHHVAVRATWSCGRVPASVTWRIGWQTLPLRGDLCHLTHSIV